MEARHCLCHYVVKQIPTIDGTTHLIFFGCDSKMKINKIQTLELEKIWMELNRKKNILNILLNVL